MGGTGTSKVLQDATFALADPFGIPRMVFRENKEAFLWDSGMVLNRDDFLILRIIEFLTFSL